MQRGRDEAVNRAADDHTCGRGNAGQRQAYWLALLPLRDDEGATPTSAPKGRPSSRLRASGLLSVQSGARRDGIAGIYGNPGIVESATYRF
jgi:hypothetical protein